MMKISVLRFRFRFWGIILLPRNSDSIIIAVDQLLSFGQGGREIVWGRPSPYHRLIRERPENTSY